MSHETKSPSFWLLSQSMSLHVKFSSSSHLLSFPQSLPSRTAQPSEPPPSCHRVPSGPRPWPCVSSLVFPTRQPAVNVIGARGAALRMEGGGGAQEQHSGEGHSRLVGNLGSPGGDSRPLLQRPGISRGLYSRTCWGVTSTLQLGSSPFTGLSQRIAAVTEEFCHQACCSPAKDTKKKVNIPWEPMKFLTFKGDSHVCLCQL